MVGAQLTPYLSISSYYTPGSRRRPPAPATARQPSREKGAETGPPPPPPPPPRASLLSLPSSRHPATNKSKMPAPVAAYPAKMACCLQLHLLRRSAPAPLPARVLLLLSTPRLRLRPVRASPGPGSSPPNSFAGWSSDSADDGADKSTLGFGPAGGETHSIHHPSSAPPYPY